MTGFFQGYPWRFLITDTPHGLLGLTGGGVTMTWADGLFTSRQIAMTLNQPTVISCAIDPDNRNVNAINVDDGDPFVAQSNRIIYAFRREAPGPIGTEDQAPWVCRAAGIIMSPEDQGDPDVPLTHLTAYDAWGFLGGRPCRNALAELPGPNGFSYFGRGNIVATTFLKNTIAADGFAFVDAGNGSRIGEGAQYADWGGTEWYGGTIEPTCEIPYNAQLGTSVGDAWTQLCDAGNMDIVLTPIYDKRRPGYTHELNIYKFAGSIKPNAVFAWDKMNRSVTTIDRMHDATPGNFINQVQYYAGQAGIPVPALGPLKNNAAILKYLVYMSMQSFPNQQFIDPSGATTLAMAHQAITMAKQGKRTVTISPTPERSPIPLVDYGLGDIVPVWATNRLRVAMSVDLSADPPLGQRVQAIPISITDDGIEEIGGLLLSPDYRDPNMACL